MNHFYLTLPSDSSSKYYPENTTASYKTKLSERLDLDGEYEIGLVQIIYPRSWYNFNNESKNMSITFHPFDEGESITHVFQSGQFPDEQTFINVLNDWISGAEIFGCIFNFDHWERKIRLLFLNKNGSVFLSSGLASMLGFDSMGPYKAQMGGKGLEAVKFKADHAFDLHAGMRLIYIYTDIVCHSAVGDVKAPLLRACTTTGVYGEMISATFTDPHYMPLAHNGIDSIEVHIRNELGRDVAFEFGKAMVTLHFRRKNKL